MAEASRRFLEALERAKGEPLDMWGSVWHKLSNAAKSVNVIAMLDAEEEKKALWWPVPSANIQDLCYESSDLKDLLEMRYHEPSSPAIVFKLGAITRMSIDVIMRLTLDVANLKAHIRALTLEDMQVVQFELRLLVEKVPVLRRCCEEALLDCQLEQEGQPRAAAPSPPMPKPFVEMPKGQVYEAVRRLVQFSTASFETVTVAFKEVDATIVEVGPHAEFLAAQLAQAAGVSEPMRVEKLGESIPRGSEEKHYKPATNHFEKQAGRYNELLRISLLGQKDGRKQLQADLQTAGFKTRIVGNSDLVVYTDKPAAGYELEMLKLACAFIELKTSANLNLKKLAAQIMLQLAGGTLRANVPVLVLGGDFCTLVSFTVAYLEDDDGVPELVIQHYKNCDPELAIVVLILWSKLASERDESGGLRFPSAFLEGAEHLRRKVVWIKESELTSSDLAALLEAQKRNDINCMQELLKK